MRYQERIYIQNQNSAVRNRNFNNFNTSSDMCVFNNPLYNISGTTKIDCCEPCLEKITPHDTYTGGTVNLPTNNPVGDCQDMTTIIRAARDQAILNYINYGVSAVTNNLNIEVISCTQVVKWRSGGSETWVMRDSNGELTSYYIDDYMNTQGTIIRHKSSDISNVCCFGEFVDSQKYWNDFLIATGYTGTTLFVDLPYSSDTSCKLNKFNCPQVNNVTGATYIISANTQTIPLTFNFTANTQSFVDTEANFRYNIYKYDNNLGTFNGIPVYKSEILQYSAFSATNMTTQYIPSSGITIDGDYIIKGFYQFSACTDFMKRLGKGVDTINYIYGDQYGIYDKNMDYYFVAVKEAEIPTFINNSTNDSSANALMQNVYLPESGVQFIPKPPNIGNFVLTLNGLVLANDLDYTYSGSVVTLNGLTEEGDIITFIYTSAGGPNLISDNIDITTTIVSGSSNNQGSNLAYFNTTSGKYEIYTSLAPSEINDLIVMLNGVTLANNIDFYQSTTNPKRIILEGDIFVGDIITIVYFPANGTVNGLINNTPVVSWKINELPQKNNGYFSLEVSTGNTFTNLYYSGYSPYNISSNFYSDSFIASGTVGTTLYYRVKNEKNYETLCGNIVTSIVYSDIIPVVIQSNAINSY